MKKYDKKDVIGVIRNILTEHSDDKMALAFAKILMDKILSADITFTSSEIEEFIFNDDGASVNETIFKLFCMLESDFKGVCFDGKIITGLRFDRLSNVYINLNNLDSKNLEYCDFSGVRLDGDLDGARLKYTNFNDYIGEVVLMPEKLSTKSIQGCNLKGIKVSGSLDNINICNVDFTGCLGDVSINPQKVTNKELIGINFCDTKLVGECNEVAGQYDDPVFDGCYIYSCKFKGASGNIVINLDTLVDFMSSKLTVCDLTGVKVIGKARAVHPKKHNILEDGRVLFIDSGNDLYGSYYNNDDGKLVNIHLYQSRMYDDEKWVYIDREQEPNLLFDVEYLIEDSKEEEILTEKVCKKNKVLSLFNGDLFK